MSPAEASVTGAGELPVGRAALDSLEAIMDDLKAHELAAINSAVGSLVGSGPGPLGDPAVIEQELIDSGLEFLISLIQPLYRCLEQVSGDTDALGARAQEWQAVAASLRDTGPQVSQLTTGVREVWTGDAASAFNSTMTEFSRTLGGAAGACDGMVILLQTSAELMAGARTRIVNIIVQVTEYMIVAEASGAAAAALTFGASSAAANASILGEVAGGVQSAIAIVDHVSELLRRIGSALTDVGTVFGRVGELLTRLGKLTPGGGGLTQAAGPVTASAQTVTEAGTVTS